MENLDNKDNKDNMPAPATPISLENFKNLTPEKKPINYKYYFDFIQGDITSMKADIIVNSSSSSMKPLCGVSKSIQNKCGASLLKFLTKNYYGILPGGFAESPNYKLNCKKILHVCSPTIEDDHLLSTIYEQCLNYCFNHDIIV